MIVLIVPVVAVLKPFRPGHVGLWRTAPDTYSMGALSHPAEGQERWADPAQHQPMVDEALAAAR